MRGSILLNFNEFVANRGPAFVVVNVNGVLRKITATECVNEYMTYVNTGDVVYIQITPNNNYPTVTKQITINRKDFTTDNENGDFGIKNTFIQTVTGNTYYLNTTFTATTRSDAYNFHYIVNCDAEPVCYDIGTGYSGTTGEPFQPAVRDIKRRNGLIYTVGNFRTYNGIPQSGMTVTNTDGSLYSGFTNLGFALSVYPTALEVLSDGKSYINGAAYGGVATNGLVRLNFNGTRDTSFSGLTSNNGVFNDMEIQSDGKIVCGGEFTSINGTTRQHICRLNTNGTLDTSFGSVSGFTGPSAVGINDVAIQSDGKVLCIGYFNAYSGVSRNNVCRLNTDGTIDTTFTSPFNSLISGNFLRIEQLSDGKILIGGSFFIVSGGTLYQVIKLNSDGTIDNSFNKISGWNFCPDFEEQSDGKIIVTLDGYGSTYDGKIYRINSDGSTDTSFNELTINDTNLLTPESICLDETNGIYYIGGGFETVNGQTFYRFVSGFLSNGDLNMCS